MLAGLAVLTPGSASFVVVSYYFVTFLVRARF